MINFVPAQYRTDHPSSSTNYNSSQLHNQNDRYSRNKVREGAWQMGFKMIQKLLENGDIEDVMFQLNNDKRGFKELLEDKNMKADIIVLVLKLLAKICSSSFQSTMIVILETALRSNFAENLVNYIAKIPMQVCSHNFYLFILTRLSVTTYSYLKKFYDKNVMGIFINCL